MKEKTRFVVSVILNGINVILTFITMSLALGGYRVNENAISDTGVAALQYFTFLSNVLMGAICVAYLVFEILFLLGKVKEIPAYMMIIKFVGTVQVALTALVVLFFLEPIVLSSGYHFLDLYQNSNLIFHFIAPVLSIITFLCFETTEKVRFKDNFFALVPVGLYIIYYTINCLTHIENGKVAPRYDFYGFVSAGPAFAPIAIIGILAATFAIAVLLRFLNRKIHKIK